jgi:hypothetical protein
MDREKFCGSDVAAMHSVASKRSEDRKGVRGDRKGTEKGSGPFS